MLRLWKACGLQERARHPALRHAFQEGVEDVLSTRIFQAIVTYLPTALAMAICAWAISLPLKPSPLLGAAWIVDTGLFVAADYYAIKRRATVLAILTTVTVCLCVALAIRSLP